jgi:hypothetical protein
MSATGARAPDDISRPARRLTGQLAAGAATANTAIIYEVIPVRGAARVKVRLKVTNTGTLDLLFVGPDFNQQQAVDGVAFGSLTGTVYTTGNPAQVAIVANTENSISSDCYGESYAIVKFTGSATGAISYCDVSQV